MFEDPTLVSSDLEGGDGMKELLISDVHGNLEALDEVLRLERWDDIYCMGDIVDYGPSPQECIERIREIAIPVKGNHDNAVVTGMECGCGYEMKELSQEVRKFSREQIDQEGMRFLADLPMYVTTHGKLLTHASLNDLFKYLKPETPEEEFRSFSDVEEDIVLLGHTHIPMDRTINGKRYINPGSLGQPRDGDWRGSYAILEDGELIFQKIEYDIDRTIEKMERMGFPERAVRILREGKVVP